MQATRKLSYTVPNVRCPFEPTATEVKVWSYNVNGNGKVIIVEPSLVWLPMSIVPGSMLPGPTV